MLLFVIARTIWTTICSITGFGGTVRGNAGGRKCNVRVGHAPHRPFHCNTPISVAPAVVRTLSWHGGQQLGGLSYSCPRSLCKTDTKRFGTGMQSPPPIQYPTRQAKYTIKDNSNVSADPFHSQCSLKNKTPHRRMTVWRPDSSYSAGHQERIPNQQ